MAADFAIRSAVHDREASDPVENYDRLREEGFLALTVGKEWGGSGAIIAPVAPQRQALLTERLQRIRNTRARI